ncbi:MAG: site-specific integrase [Gammaproteobacteria bacterium]
MAITEIQPLEVSAPAFQMLSTKLGIQDYLELSTANNTRRAYRSDIRHFETWGGQLPTRPEIVLEYIRSFAEILNPRTIERRLTAIKQWHVYQKFPDPTDNPLIKKMILGIRRIHGSPKKKAPALSLEQIEAMVLFLKQTACSELNPAQAQAIRNNALIQIGFFGAFRRSELVAIEYEHLTWVEQGLEILIPRSKTDAFGQGSICAIPYGKAPLCAVSALKAWLEYSEIKTGPVFKLNDKSISDIIKRLAKAINLPHWEEYSGHSLRRGLATAAARAGGSLMSIMNQGRWKNTQTVLGYIQEASKFDENVVNTFFS